MEKKLRNKGSLVALVLIALLSLNLCSYVYAEESTLDVVLKRGTLIVGVILTAPPYGMYDPKTKEPIGYDVDIAKAIAKELGVKLEIVETTAPNRVPYLLTKKVDVIVAVFGNTLERAKSIAFTMPYAPYKLVLLGYKKDKDIKSYKDLSGKRLGVPTGTTQDIILTEIAPKGTQIFRFVDDAASHQALIAGKVDVIGTGEVIALQLAKENPALELKGDVKRTFPCMGVRRGDIEWLNWLNLFIFHYGESGKLAELYEKWFEVPMSQIMPIF